MDDDDSEKIEKIITNLYGVDSYEELDALFEGKDKQDEEG